MGSKAHQPQPFVGVIHPDVTFGRRVLRLATLAGYKAAHCERPEEWLDRDTGLDPGCVVFQPTTAKSSGRFLLLMPASLARLPAIHYAVASSPIRIDLPCDAGSLGKAISEALRLDAEHVASREERMPVRSVLTPRENQVLDLLVSGLNTKQIARCLQISPKTAETHRSRVLKKTCASSVVVLVARVLAGARTIPPASPRRARRIGTNRTNTSGKP